MTDRTEASAAIRALFGERNYRLLLAGQGLGLLGEQINLIALPWLALQISGDAMALGSVLAIGGIPPALLMLFGGATTDRLTPRALMLVVDALRLTLVLALFAFLLTGSIALWMLYPLSLAFGLLSAFSMPAVSSITRTLLSDQDLQVGNSFFQSLTQAAAVIGPALAGFILKAGTAAAGETTPPSAAIPVPGLALAFGIYAMGLALSVLTLWGMRMPGLISPAIKNSHSNLLAEMGQAIRFARSEPLLRLLIFLLLALNFLLTGPFAVGVPVLSQVHFAGGAAAFGVLVSSYAAGSLAGFLMAGFYRRSGGTGLLLIAILIGYGVGMFLLSWVRDLRIALLIPFILGAGNGYLGVILKTLLQQRSPRELVGRVMSLFLFGRTALAPVSNIVSGALIVWSLDGLFWTAGTFLIVLGGVIAISPVPRLFERQVEVASERAQPIVSIPDSR